MRTPQKDEALLEAIYEGSNTLDPEKRDKSIQIKNFGSKGHVVANALLAGYVKDKDVNNNSILNHAISAYNKPAIKWLLKQNPKLVNYVVGKMEQHPLLHAAAMNSSKMIDIILLYKDHIDFNAKARNVEGNCETVYKCICESRDIEKHIKRKIQEAYKEYDKKLKQSQQDEFQRKFKELTFDNRKSTQKIGKHSDPSEESDSESEENNSLPLLK